MSDDISWRAKLRALRRVLAWKPYLTLGIVAFSIFAAVLEGIGLSFILPIIELGTGEVDHHVAYFAKAISIDK